MGVGGGNKRERSTGGKKEGEEKVLRQDIGLDLNLFCTSHKRNKRNTLG